MVLVPECGCCLTKCQSLAQRVLNAGSVQIDFSVTSYDRSRVGTVYHQCEYLSAPPVDLCGYPVGHAFGSREVCRGQDFTGTFSLTKYYQYKDVSYAFSAFKYQFSAGTSIVMEAYSAVVNGSYSLSEVKVGGNAAGIIQFNRSSSSVSAPSLYSASGTGCDCGVADTNPVSRAYFSLIPSSWVEFLTEDFFKATGVRFYCDESFAFESVTGSAVANGYANRTNTTFPTVPGSEFRRAMFDDEPDTAPQTTISFSNLVVP